MPVHRDGGSCAGYLKSHRRDHLTRAVGLAKLSAESERHGFRKDAWKGVKTVAQQSPQSPTQNMVLDQQLGITWESMRNAEFRAPPGPAASESAF